MHRLAILVLLVGFVAAPAAFAQGVHGDAKIALHVEPQFTGKGGPCGVWDLANSPCSVVNTAAGLNASYDVYVLIMQGAAGNTIAGCTIGLFYDGQLATMANPTPGAGVVCFGWTLCASQEFAMTAWPETGSGNVITWDAINDCQTTDPGDGITALAGWLYMYAYDPGQVAILNHPAAQSLKVADCGAVESTIPEPSGGFVQFASGGASQGCNPCDIDCFSTPVEETSWGGIKKLFGDGE